MIQQRTDEWFEARRGKATASRFGDVLAKTKAGVEGAGRRNYRAELVIERITGLSPERYSSRDMEWGAETEDLAALAYTLRTGIDTAEAPFVEHPAILAGASPDRFVGTEGLLEIKCPKSGNHIATLKANKMPPEHMPQVQGQLWMTVRQWCDFVSYDPNMPANAQLFIERVYRDEEYIRMLENEVSMFLEEVAAEVEFVKGYGL